MKQQAPRQEIKLTTSGVEISKLGIDQMTQSCYWHCPNQNLIATRTFPIIPFALNLGTNQPSGSLNFSRLENIQLSSPANMTGTETISTVTAVNSNVLLIRNGMGGLEFSN